MNALNIACMPSCTLIDVVEIYKIIILVIFVNVNTLRMGDADLRFYITTVQDG